MYGSDYWLDGGGIRGEGTHAVIEFNIITGNSNSNSYYGAGVRQCNGLIQNNIIAYNEGKCLDLCNGELRNNTIYGNTMGIFSCQGVIANCIIWNDSANQLDGCSTPAYSCIKYWRDGGTGNIADDPKLANPSEGDYSLRAASFCIDAGMRFDDLFVDLAGTFRPYDGTLEVRGDGSDYDIGAFEYAGCRTLGPPHSLTASMGENTDLINLSWDAINGADTYEVFRTSGTMFLEGEKIAETTGTAFVDSTAPCAWRYYWVRVKDGCAGAVAGPALGYRQCPGSIVGSVYSNMDSLPAHGVRITAMHGDGTPGEYSSLARPDGGFEIAGIPKGSYFLKLSKPGHPTKLAHAGARFEVEYGEQVNRGAISFDYLIVPSHYPEIQQAIDAAQEGDEIVVQPGHYLVNLQLNGKDVTLRSDNPADWDMVTSTVLDGSGGGPVVSFDGSETAACVISGFTITRGNGKNFWTGSWGAPSDQTYGGGLYSDYRRGGAKATLRNCIITRNITSSYYNEGGGGGIYNCDGLIENCLIYNNATDAVGGGLSECDGFIRNCVIADNVSTGGWSFLSRAGGLNSCDAQLINSIIWNNAALNDPQLSNSTTPSFCCIQDWTGPGVGNITDDPLFVDPANGDYRLRAGSPCIDAGAFVVGLNAGLEGLPRGLDGDERGAGPTGDGSEFDMGAFEFRPLRPAARLVVARSDHSGESHPYGPLIEYQGRGSFHLAEARDHETRMTTGGVWMEWQCREDDPDAALLVITYDDATGAVNPYGLPEGYLSRGSFHVDAGVDYAGRTLSGGGWMTLMQREDDPNPLYLVITYDDTTGELNPFGAPAAYEERGSLHVAGGADYQGNETGPCWIGFFYPRVLRALSPAQCRAAGHWTLY